MPSPKKPTQSPRSPAGKKRPGPARGGQPGNANAQVHGFYSDQFSEDELALIARFVADPTIDDELWMQRVVNRRLLARLDADAQGEPLPIEELTKLAEAMAAGTGRVAKLLRDRRALSGDAADGLMGAIGTVLDELKTELGIDL